MHEHDHTRGLDAGLRWLVDMEITTDRFASAS
jgi:hypothetical protein